MTEKRKGSDGAYQFRIPILKVGRYSATDWFVAFSVFIAIIWKPLVTWVLEFDAAGRVPFVLIAAALVLYAGRIWKTSFRFPLALYCFVAVYMFINGYLQQGYQTYPSDGVYLMFCSALQAPAIMLLVAAAAKKDYDCTLDWLILTLYFYILLALFFSGIIRSHRLSLDINANEIALFAACLCILLLLKYFRRRLSFPALIGLLAIPTYLIILSGSRMGLAMIAIMFVAAIFIGQSIRNVKSMGLSILLILLFALAMYYILKETQIGHRMMETTIQTEQEKAIGTSTILDKFGDRGLQYFYSFPYFLEHPVFGIGFKNWILYNPYKIVAHSEYIVQYVENGLVAFIPYMVFFIALTGRGWRGRRHTDRTARRSSLLLFFAMLTIAFSNTVLWSHDHFCIFVIYALCFSAETPDRKHPRRRIRFTFGKKGKDA